MKTTKIKTKRYLLFYGTEKTTGTNGNIEDETYQGDFSTTSDATLELVFAKIGAKPKELWSYIWDTKTKDVHSWSYNCDDFLMHKL